MAWQFPSIPGQFQDRALSSAGTTALPASGSQLESYSGNIPCAPGSVLAAMPSPFSVKQTHPGCGSSPELRPVGPQALKQSWLLLPRYIPRAKGPGARTPGRTLLRAAFLPSPSPTLITVKASTHETCSGATSRSVLWILVLSGLKLSGTVFWCLISTSSDNTGNCHQLVIKATA